MDVAERLSAMGLPWPGVRQPGGHYELWRIVGDLVYLAGNTGSIDGKLKWTGRVGTEVTIEQGYEMAQLCAVNHLRELVELLGDLDRVARCVRLTGWVNSAHPFSG